MARPRKDPAEKVVQQTVHLKPEIVELLNAYCAAEERTISWVVDKALRQFLKVED